MNILQNKPPCFRHWAMMVLTFLLAFGLMGQANATVSYTTSPSQGSQANGSIIWLRLDSISGSTGNFTVGKIGGGTFTSSAYFVIFKDGIFQTYVSYSAGTSTASISVDLGSTSGNWYVQRYDSTYGYDTGIISGNIWINTVDVQPPSPPALWYPVNGASDISTTDTTTFQWSSVGGADNYRIVISQDSQFNGFNETTRTCDGTCFTYPDSGSTLLQTYYFKQGMNLAGHTYYWKVRVNTSAGTSNWSDVYSFTTKPLVQLPSPPTLSYPSDGASNISTVDTTTFQWSSVAGADNYRIVISHDSQFNGFNEATRTCDGTCFTYPDSGSSLLQTYYPKQGMNLAGHTYYWKVRVNTSAGTSDWSTPYSFTTKPNIFVSNFTPQTTPYVNTPTVFMVTGGNFTSQTVAEIIGASCSATQLNNSISLQVTCQYAVPGALAAQVRDSSTIVPAGSITFQTKTVTDTTPPTVSSFTASSASVTVGQPASFNYSVSDTGGLNRIELWKTSDLNGSPNPNGWQEVTSARKSLSGTSSSGSLTDTSSTASIYWYGVHVVDTANNMAKEPSTIKVTFANQLTDTTPPTVSSFTASSASITVGQPASFNYSVSDTGGLNRIELWKTSDLNGSPNSSGWQEVTLARKSLSGTSSSSSLADTSSTAGTYWYGVHVVDTANNIGKELSAIKVTFTTKPTSGDGLVAYYCFDDATNIGKDCSTNGNNGSPIGTVNSVAGWKGNAASFGGYKSPASIHIPNSTSLQFSQDFSVAFAVKMTGFDGLNGYNTYATSGVHAVFAKSHDRTGMALIAYGDATGNTNMSVASSEWGNNGNGIGGAASNSAVGKWVHFTYIFSNTLHTAKMYANGVLISTKTGFNQNFTSINSQDLYFGKYSDFWYPLNGSLDEVRIYNRALTDAEATALYTPSTTPTTSSTAFDVSTQSTISMDFGSNYDAKNAKVVELKNTTATAIKVSNVVVSEASNFWVNLFVDDKAGCRATNYSTTVKNFTIPANSSCKVAIGFSPFSDTTKNTVISNTVTFVTNFGQKYITVQGNGRAQVANAYNNSSSLWGQCTWGVAELKGGNPLMNTTLAGSPNTYGAAKFWYGGVTDKTTQKTTPSVGNVVVFAGNSASTNGHVGVVIQTTPVVTMLSMNDVTDQYGVRTGKWSVRPISWYPNKSGATWKPLITGINTTSINHYGFFDWNSSSY